MTTVEAYPGSANDAVPVKVSAFAGTFAKCPECLLFLSVGFLTMGPHIG